MWWDVIYETRLILGRHVGRVVRRSKALDEARAVNVLTSIHKDCCGVHIQLQFFYLFYQVSSNSGYNYVISA
jgi:hypothetical protein